MDAQGYVIDGEFLIKEVAVVSHKFTTNVLCDAYYDKEKVMPKDKSTIDWTYRYIGLPLDSKDDYHVAYDSKATRKYRGMDVVKRLYEWVETDERPYVAIKNTQLIPTLIALDIPFINLPEKYSPPLGHVYHLLANTTCTYHKKEMTKCAIAKATALWNMLIIQNN